MISADDSKALGYIETKQRHVDPDKSMLGEHRLPCRQSLRMRTVTCADLLADALQR